MLSTVCCDNNHFVLLCKCITISVDRSVRCIAIYKYNKKKSSFYRSFNWISPLTYPSSCMDSMLCVCVCDLISIFINTTNLPIEFYHDRVYKILPINYINAYDPKQNYIYRNEIQTDRLEWFCVRISQSGKKATISISHSIKHANYKA